jgi:protein TonB
VTAGLHLLLAAALLQTRAVRDAVFEAAPVFVQFLSQPEAQPEARSEALRLADAAPPTLAPAAMASPPPPTVLPLPPPTWTMIETQPGAEPMNAASRAAASEAAAIALEPQAAAGSASASAASAVVTPVPPSPPRLIPAAAVQFTLPPVIEYPRLARRNAESGLVIVRAHVGVEGGPPRSVQIEKSSGHARLDQAALLAVQKARFKPHSENGRGVEGWALVPIHFELES